MPYAPYRKLDDAERVTGDVRYLGRSAEVWYMKPEVFRDFSMGVKFILSQGERALPTRATLGETHVFLGEVGARDPDEVWEMMQAEVWSPGGEARGFLQSRGVKHTSMSVGDVVVVDDHLHMIDSVGSKRIALRKAVIRLAYERPELRAHLLPLIQKTAVQVVSPSSILHRSVLNDLITPEEARSSLFQRAAEEAADRINEGWLEGEGFGSSDMTFVQEDMLNIAGIPNAYRNGRLVRTDQGGPPGSHT